MGFPHCVFSMRVCGPTPSKLLYTPPTPPPPPPSCKCMVLLLFSVGSFCVVLYGIAGLCVMAAMHNED